MPAPDRTSLGEIIAAGRELLESAGPPGVTMQAVANSVGVRAPSLYKRVKDRDALLQMVADATLDDLVGALADEADLRSVAKSFRAFAQRRPEGFRLIFSRATSEGKLAAASEPILRVVRPLVGDDDALDAARLVTAWANGFLSMELSGAFRLGGDVDAAFEFGLDRIIEALKIDASIPHSSRLPRD